MTTLTRILRRWCTHPAMPRGSSPRLLVTLHPNALLTIREARRTSELTFDLGRLYARAVIENALARRPTPRRRPAQKRGTQ